MKIIFKWIGDKFNSRALSAKMIRNMYFLKHDHDDHGEKGKFDDINGPDKNHDHHDHDREFM